MIKLTKEQKIKFVNEQQMELKKYSVVGVLPVNGIPDRLVQASRNKMRPQVKFIIAKKSLLARILDGDAKTKPLAKELTGMSAILLSNDDPFVIYKGFKSNSLKLSAKPKQRAPEDINISGGETSIQPGQAVTELKSAGIDVQIQKGKVVIAKDKTLVKKGEVISLAVSKALKTLDIQPFTVSIEPSIMLFGGLTFTRDILGINPAQVTSEISLGFLQSFALSLKAKIVNRYTIVPMITDAFRSAIAVGYTAKLYESGIIDKLVAEAALQAIALNVMVKEAPSEGPASSAGSAAAPAEIK
jgi:large subunit ribosomal protein L10